MTAWFGNPQSRAANVNNIERVTWTEYHHAPVSPNAKTVGMQNLGRLYVVNGAMWEGSPWINAIFWRERSRSNNGGTVGGISLKNRSGEQLVISEVVRHRKSDSPFWESHELQIMRWSPGAKNPEFTGYIHEHLHN